MPDKQPPRPSVPDHLDVPPSLLAHDTGLSAERMRELFAAEDAYSPRPAARPTDDA